MTRATESVKPLAPRNRLTAWFKQVKIPSLKPEVLLISSALLAVAGLTLTQQDIAPPTTGPDPSQFCQEMVQPKAVMSRDQLAQLLAVPERGDRTKVQSIVKQPYCRMANLSIRAGTVTERVAYPLDFDPQTWLVILYEGKSYV